MPSSGLVNIRRKSIPVRVGGVYIGGTAPIAVQSMTDTNTEDRDATIRQVIELAESGSDLVRMTVNTEKAAQQVPFIRDKVREAGYSVPLIGDFHYNGHRLLKAYPACAEALDKYRVNPGNLGYGNKWELHFAQLIEIALRFEKPVRIGVNWGSLDPKLQAQQMEKNALSKRPRSSREVLRETLVLSALDSAEKAEKIGLPAHRIVLSCKVSQGPDLIAIHRDLARRCAYAIHLGLTEAGLGLKGIVATSTVLGTLLQEGIGDTIRASLTPGPGTHRAQEVLVCQHILQSLELRAFKPSVSACPGCGRTSNTYFQKLASQVEAYINQRIPLWRQQYDGVEKFTIAVMGCVVNGPGESKQANLGISLPGRGEHPVAPIFSNGRKIATLRGDNIAEQFQALMEDYVAEHYPKRQ